VESEVRHTLAAAASFRRPPRYQVIEVRLRTCLGLFTLQIICLILLWTRCKIRVGKGRLLLHALILR